MIPGSKAPKAFRACTKGFELENPQKHEDAAIFKENQRIRMFLELRKLHSNGAIRGYQLGTVMILLFMAVRFCFNIYFLVSFISFLFCYLIYFIAAARLCKFFGKLWI